ncbi:hypothetical protein CI109_105940 [Kwoniella shandongensis]|uniref:Protein YAE1 n=1 Tax=Kwoniella shandongensis TaxID=1734106 RepID=A0A5M6C182_9TREE|nr:uncharacterized protein CI109_004012 [Kwoniella shandongensis]KAA5527752.1 hypothetical protein CI109_004012 [Kwoniella shandongensis]
MTYPINDTSMPIADEDDDWYAPPAQGGAEDPLVDQEYTRLASRYSDAGYREGITDGKLSTLQRGFDESFAQSVPLSRQIGNLRGRAAALLSFLTTDPSVGVRVEDLRELIRELGKLRRDQILPQDEERIAHEREEHDGEAYELDVNDNREMEGLEKSLDLLSGGGNTSATGTNGTKEDGETVLRSLEERLRALEKNLQ